MSLLDYENLPHECTAQRRARESRSGGGTKDVWTDLWDESRRCWKQPATDTDREFAMRRDIAVSHKVFFTSDPGVDERDRLVFDDGGYLVRTRPKPDASVGMGVVWRVMIDDGR